MLNPFFTRAFASTIVNFILISDGETTISPPISKPTNIYVPPYGIPYTNTYYKGKRKPLPLITLFILSPHTKLRFLLFILTCNIKFFF